MAKEQSEHDIFYRAIHACIMAHITEDTAEMAAYHARFEKNPDNWTRAMACGFYRMGYDHLGLISGDPDEEIVMIVQGKETGKFSCPTSAFNDYDFYELDAEQFVQILFAEELKEDPKKYEATMQLDIVRKGFEAVLKYDKVVAALSLDEIKNMAVGLGKLVLFYPPFYDEAQRDGIMENLSFNITEDMLGEWPAD